MNPEKKPDKKDSGVIPDFQQIILPSFPSSTHPMYYSHAPNSYFFPGSILNTTLNPFLFNPFPLPIPNSIGESFTQAIPTETEVADSLVILQNTPKSRPAAVIIKIIEAPQGEKLVAKKRIDFVLFVKYDNSSIDEKMYIVPILFNAKTNMKISKGLTKGSFKFKKEEIPDTEDAKFPVIGYRPHDITLKIIKGSAKKDIRIFIRFELRMYKDKSRYDIISKTDSQVYRMYTHSTQINS